MTETSSCSDSMYNACGHWDGGRIELIDALRGLSVLLMILHHFAIDLEMFGMLPASWVYSDIVYALHLIFASVFISLSGVSSRFSRSNVKRGIKVLVCAAIVTLVTWIMDMTIWFGILHFLGISMIIYGLLSRWLDKLNPVLGVIIYFVSFVILSIFILDKTFDIKYLSILGLRNRNFTSADYFPIFPWILMFMFGTCLGRIIREGNMPAWFYKVKVKFLPSVGRKSLWIYMLHQPVCYGITLLMNELIN